MMQSNPPEIAVGGAPLRLLIVDGDDDDRARVRRALARTPFKFSAMEAGSMREARQYLGGNAFDCVLLDCHVDGAVGGDLLADIGALSDPHLPVVMITSQGDEHLLAGDMTNDLCDYIPKENLEADLLGNVLSNSLRRASLQREIHSQRARLQQLSLYDVLTGLPNRSLFFDRLDQALQGAQRNASSFAVLHIDLDLFKEVNDNFGHAAGDSVLVVAARRFRNVLRATDTVARLSGDEFAAVLIGTESAQAAMTTAGKIGMAVREPIMVSGNRIQVGASIGIALFPDHAGDADALLAIAGRATNSAKSSGGSAVYSANMDTVDRPRLVASRLQKAIDQKELFVEFQPMINLTSRKVIGAEALVRWRSPEEGIVLPGAFIPIAERSPVIGPLTYAIVDMTLDQAKFWYDAAIPIPVSINLSARLLDDDRLPERVVQALESRGLPSQLLTLELTETALMSNVKQAKKILGLLSAAGVKISIDDFGAGFSSFKYLRELDVSEIKIDQAFTADLREGSRDNTIVRSIALLARGFGIPAIAEGIEDPQACNILRDLGCDKGQGFAIARPMPGAEFLDWLLRWELAAAPVGVVQ